MANQNDIDRILDRRDKGEITTLQANVEIIRCEGVRLIEGRIPQEIRKALNAAVKAGELGHLKREKFKPEAYFHPNSRQRAIAERNAEERESYRRLAGVVASTTHTTITTAGDASTEIIDHCARCGVGSTTALPFIDDDDTSERFALCSPCYRAAATTEATSLSAFIASKEQQ